MRRLAVLPCMLIACTEPLIEAERRPIIGGEVSPAGSYPTTGVTLTVYDFGGGMTFGTMTCTGTLIAPDVVLMAAHCTIDFFGGAVPFETYFTFERDVSTFGMENSDLPPDAVRIRTQVPHPEFDFNDQPPPGLQNYKDVGLAFLDTPVTDVVPAVVADEVDGVRLTVGMAVEIVGYGQRAQNAEEAGLKHEAITFINEVGTHEMQIGDQPPGNPQKCHGDSGGPTYVDIDDGRTPLQRVIGITSRAYDAQVDCMAGGIDMRADAFRTWFDTEMRQQCADGLRPAEVCTDGGGLPVPGGVAPMLDAGFVDTGVSVEDSGVADAGSSVDAGAAVDSGAKPITPGGPRRDEGCGCSARPGSRGAPPLLLWVLLALGLREKPTEGHV